MQLTSNWIAAAALVLAAACAGSPAAPPTAPPTTGAASRPLVEPGLAKVGDRTRCPVSGDEFVVAADSPKAEYGGKTYYFCCASCAPDFTADPAKYAARK